MGVAQRQFTTTPPLHYLGNINVEEGNMLSIKQKNKYMTVHLIYMLGINLALRNTNRREFNNPCMHVYMPTQASQTGEHPVQAVVDN